MIDYSLVFFDFAHSFLYDETQQIFIIIKDKQNTNRGVLVGFHDAFSSLLHSIIRLISLIVSDRLEIDVVHGVLGCDALRVVVSQHLAEQIKRLI